MSMHEQFYGDKSLPEPSEYQSVEVEHLECPQCVVDYYHKNHMSFEELDMWWSTFTLEEQDEMLEASQEDEV